MRLDTRKARAPSPGHDYKLLPAVQHKPSILLENLCNDTGTNRTAAFTDSEAQTFFHRDRSNQLHRDRHVVARHNHFLVLRQLDRTRYVRGTEVELRAIVVEERRVTTAFVLAQHIHFSREVRVRRDRTRLRQHLAALHVFTLRAAQQDTHVVARLTLVEQLAEHFHARAGRLHRRLDTDDFDFLANLHHATLDTARHHRAATRDREHVFHRHQERAVDRALRRRDVCVQRVGQVHDRHFAQLARVAFQRQLRRTLDDRRVVAREVVLRQKLAHFHFHQFQQLGIIHHVALVQEHDDVRHAHLASQQDVFTRLRHRAVSGRTHQDRAVHLRCARDHVLHIVSVARAVDVCVVAIRRFVLDVRRVDRDATCLFLRRRVDLVVGLRFATELLRQHRCDCCRQRGLAVVDVTNRAYVDVRLGPFEFTFCHFRLLTGFFRTLRRAQTVWTNVDGAHEQDRTADLSLTKGVLYH